MQVPMYLPFPVKSPKVVKKRKGSYDPDYHPTPQKSKAKRPKNIIGAGIFTSSESESDDSESSGKVVKKAKKVLGSGPREKPAERAADSVTIPDATVSDYCSKCQYPPRGREEVAVHRFSCSVSGAFPVSTYAFQTLKVDSYAECAKCFAIVDKCHWAELADHLSQEHGGFDRKAIALFLLPRLELSEFQLHSSAPTSTFSDPTDAEHNQSEISSQASRSYNKSFHCGFCANVSFTKHKRL